MKKREIIVLVLVLLLLTFPVRAVECSHDFQWVSMEPTCESDGYQGYVCSLCGQTSDFLPIPALGHLEGEWVLTDPPTCTETGLEESLCSRCGQTVSRGVPALGHSYETTVEPPTCGRDGYTRHTCTVCGHEERTDRTEKLGHNYIAIVIPPTCTADGYTRHVCENCGDVYRTDTVKKTGHHYDDGVETKEPTLETKGRIVYTCVDCGVTRTEYTDYYVNPFVDISEDAFYFKGVLWASNTGVTQGIDATHFSPDQICTRAQVVTFLWRAAGKPEPENTGNPFVDVQEGTFYCKAVLWAAQNGITSGVDEDHFDPNGSCTRAQVVTFLHRSKGSPEPVSEAGFRDVSPSRYYCDAVNWAFENGVTSGVTTSTFAPDQPCTRGQIVTFLYRARKL